MLYGREHELDQLREALATAAQGIGAIVVISGPFGAGKSALLHAAGQLTARSGARVLRATASRLERDYAFSVLRQLVEPVVAEPSLSVLDASAGDQTDPTVGEGGAGLDLELLERVRGLLTDLSDERPVVMLVDDVHWADQETLHCLAYVAGRLEATRLILVVTVRDGDVGVDRPVVRHLTRCATLELRPGNLCESQVQAMVIAHLGASSDGFAAAVHAVTGGNPLLVRAILSDLALRGIRAGDEGTTAVYDARPHSLHRLFVSRLLGQSAPVRAFASALCVLGASVRADLVGRLAGLDQHSWVNALHTLCRQGLVVRTDTLLRFVHPTVEAAVYELVGAPVMGQLHAVAAKLLHTVGRPAVEVAGHVLAAPARSDRWMAQILREAAAAAVHRGEYEAAVRYLRRALLSVPVDSVERGDLLSDLAAAESATDPVVAIRHLLEAVQLLRSDEDRASALVRPPPSTLAAAPVEVIAAARRVVRGLTRSAESGGQRPDLALRLEARIRWFGEDDATELAASVTRLRTIDRPQHLRSSAGRELLAALLHCAVLTGTVPSEEVLPVARHIVRAASPEIAYLLTPLVLANMVLAIAGDAASASAWMSVARDEVSRHRDPVARAVAAVYSALVLASTGQWGQAMALVEPDMGELNGTWFDAAPGPALLLAVMASRMPNLQLTERIVGCCGRYADRPVVGALRQLLASIRAEADGALELALELLLDTGRQFDQIGWANPEVLCWLSRAASVQHQLGDVCAAQSLAEMELARAQTWGSAMAIGRALRLVGEVTPGPEGVRATRDSLELFESSGTTPERARSLLQLARLLKDTRPDEALRYLREGGRLARMSDAGFLIDDSVARDAVSPAPNNNRGLTAAESRVAELVVAGSNNGNIAELLGISRRGVEKHLTNVYRKLGIDGRKELAGALIDRSELAV